MKMSMYVDVAVTITIIEDNPNTAEQEPETTRHVHEYHGPPDVGAVMLRAMADKIDLPKPIVPVFDTRDNAPF